MDDRSVKQRFPSLSEESGEVGKGSQDRPRWYWGLFSRDPSRVSTGLQRRRDRDQRLVVPRFTPF